MEKKYKLVPVGGGYEQYECKCDTCGTMYRDLGQSVQNNNFICVWCWVEG